MRPREERGDRLKWLQDLAGIQIGKWRLNYFVGMGHVGVVYHASSTQIPDFDVALKIFLENPQPGWETEVRKVTKLRSVDGVVAFHELGTELVNRIARSELLVYTVWDFVSPGRSLRDFVQSGQACSASFLVGVVDAILVVLNACRVRGVARHGDLHAGNLLIGEQDHARLDATLTPRLPIFITDFGYGATGAYKRPKDDYFGLAEIGELILGGIDWDRATGQDRRVILGVRDLLRKLATESSGSERQAPIEILRALRGLTSSTQSSAFTQSSAGEMTAQMQVGQFQVSEMLGERWHLWKHLFVLGIPSKTRLLEPDIATVLTGPRGCGKTMLFRRLSERLLLECGPVFAQEKTPSFLAFYVSANDFADAFARYPENPDEHWVRRLTSYANLCILSEVLGVVASWRRLRDQKPSEQLYLRIREWLGLAAGEKPLLVREDPLDALRYHLEQLKWHFPSDDDRELEALVRELGRHDWIRHLVAALRETCPEAASRNVLFLVDDFSTPRVSNSMQKVLNRLLFQRGSDFVFKIATEAATTFVPEDLTGKILSDGDDYLLVDMAEESLFLSERERGQFLAQVFDRRLKVDPRLPHSRATLGDLLGQLGVGKTEFARRLRGESTTAFAQQGGDSRRGNTKPKALYAGEDVFSCLWSGDTRLMIQLIQDLVEEGLGANNLQEPISPEIQDRVFRNRGGAWLDMQARNQPTDARRVDTLAKRRQDFRWTGGSYGAHLKAVVEAFTEVARIQLLGATYIDESGGTRREVPRMAFRIEVTDRFRLDDLEAEIYRDLIRYGMFLRDNRGKSVRGAMVPRLFLRRLLLPYCVLPLSRRDSVQLDCSLFSRLLSAPDSFPAEWRALRYGLEGVDPNQIAMPFADTPIAPLPQYDEDDFPAK